MENNKTRYWMSSGIIYRTYDTHISTQKVNLEKEMIKERKSITFGRDEIFRMSFYGKYMKQE